MQITGFKTPLHTDWLSVLQDIDTAQGCLCQQRLHPWHCPSICSDPERSSKLFFFFFARRNIQVMLAGDTKNVSWNVYFTPLLEVLPCVIKAIQPSERWLYLHNVSGALQTVALKVISIQGWSINTTCNFRYYSGWFARLPQWSLNYPLPSRLHLYIRPPEWP